MPRPIPQPAHPQPAQRARRKATRDGRAEGGRAEGEGRGISSGSAGHVARAGLAGGGGGEALHGKTFCSMAYAMGGV